MKLRALVLGVVACGLAVFASRLAETSEARELEASVAAPRDARVRTEVARIQRVARASRIIEPIVEDEPVIDDEPESFEHISIEDRRADYLAELATLVNDDDHGAMQGQILDRKTGEALAGVTVVVALPGHRETQAAITDENGFYDLVDLEPGTYLVTFYYIETAVERSVSVARGELTPVFQSLETRSQRGFGGCE